MNHGRLLLKPNLSAFTNRGSGSYAENNHHDNEGKAEIWGYCGASLGRWYRQRHNRPRTEQKAIWYMRRHLEKCKSFWSCKRYWFSSAPIHLESCLRCLAGGLSLFGWYGKGSLFDIVVRESKLELERAVHTPLSCPFYVRCNCKITVTASSSLALYKNVLFLALIMRNNWLTKPHQRTCIVIYVLWYW